MLLECYSREKMRVDFGFSFKSMRTNEFDELYLFKMNIPASVSRLMKVSSINLLVTF